MSTPQKPEQIGICSWSTHAKGPDELIERLDQIGLKNVQLALNGLLDADSPWQDIQAKMSAKGFNIVSGMFGTIGEDYSTVETIRRTGGVVPDETWEGNWKIVQGVAKVAHELGLELVSTHAGFLPHDDSDPNFQKLVDRISQIAVEFSNYGLSLLFETGQETAETLTHFIEALIANGSANVGVNFDPANMILYDMGEPVESLRALMPHVQQIHIKDGIRTTVKGEWGKEVPIGDGEVDWNAFLGVLAVHDYTGNMVIEREAGEDRVGDVRTAIARITEAMRTS
ncbi:MAG: sugar phosphate isomerase/epimerase [Planctomycetota bacterium]|nr:sugar phosphate isomerase/epimerase [Planctomycetota bacterium]MDA1138525.1 sugar phosphate isomerase/epimerase [Planctomycetota bacterium]